MSSKQNEQPSRKPWRDVLPIHPAALMFPRMTPDELKALGEDIKAHGLTSPIAIWEKRGSPLMLLDGRSRLDGMEAVGIEIIVEPSGTKREPDVRLWYCFDYEPERKWPIDSVRVRGDWGADPYAYVISANIHRRHLTAEQKRDLIAKLIKATPEKSDRQIAETVKVSPTTVGTVRAEMEAKGDVSKLDTRRDSKGREQPASKPSRPTTKPQAAPAADVHAVRGACAKRIRALMGQPEPPAREDIGATSAGEIARKDAEIEELRNAKRRLEIENTGLRSEIEDLRRENAALRESLEQATGKFIKLSGEFDELRDRIGRPAPPVDPGPIPGFLDRTKQGAAS